MVHRTANYTAFYVKEPASESNLAANATKDFVYYRQLQAWKKTDPEFPFVNAHDKTYDVRDNSDWDTTLKPRLHQRLNASKNIILFLSAITKGSRALSEEMEYGIGYKKLPVIVIYPGFSKILDIVDNKGYIRSQIKNLWNNLPAFKNNMNKVATVHIPMNKELIGWALSQPGYMVNSMNKPGIYYPWKELD